MNKQEFLNILRKSLSSLPSDEIDEMVNYYDEYISDSKNELEAIKSLAHPKILASKILAESNIKESKSGEKKKNTSLVTVILLLLSAPISIPIAIAVLAIVFAAIVTILVLIFSVAVTTFALVTAAFALVIHNISVGFTSFANSIFLIGFLVSSIGLFALSIIFIKFIIKKIIIGLNIIISKLVNKRY